MDIEGASHTSISRYMLRLMNASISDSCAAAELIASSVVTSSSCVAGLGTGPVAETVVEVPGALDLFGTGDLDLERWTGIRDGIGDRDFERLLAPALKPNERDGVGAGAGMGTGAEVGAGSGSVSAAVWTSVTSVASVTSSAFASTSSAAAAAACCRMCTHRY